MILWDVKDQRQNPTYVVKVRMKALQYMSEVAEIPVESALEIRVRFRDWEEGKPVGEVKYVSKGVYRVVLRLLPKKSLSPKARYVLNNTLLHELRHIAQAELFGFVVLSMFHEEKEVEAQEYGRKARLNELGKKVWAIN